MNAAPIRQTLHAATAALPDSATPHLDAEILLAHTLGLSRAALLACGNDPLPASARAAFDILITRRAAGEPVAYLTGHAWFFGLDLAVTPAVLIPRPETEGLAEWAIRWVGGWSGRLPPAPLTLLDIGTGSGALALALAANLPPSSSDGRAIEIHASDISPAALDVARCNADRLGLSDRVTFHQADLVPSVLSVLPAPPVPPTFDLVVANLPYVGIHERANVAPDVLLWEPHVALFAGADGLDAIRRLLAALPGRLNPGAAVGLEIGWQQGAAVTALARAAFPDARVALARDLAGLDRVVTIVT